MILERECSSFEEYRREVAGGARTQVPPVSAGEVRVVEVQLEAELELEVEVLEVEVLLWVPEVVDLVVVVLDDFRPYLLVDRGSLNSHAAMDRL